MRIALAFVILVVLFSSCCLSKQSNWVELPQNSTVAPMESPNVTTQKKVISGLILRMVNKTDYKPLHVTSVVTFEGQGSIRFENQSALGKSIVGKICRIEYDQNTLANSEVRNIARNVSCLEPQ